MPEPGRDLALLPKAHLHLHFTGSLRLSTLHELAAHHGQRLPEALTAGWPPQLSGADERGWFRFQRLYDAARACVQGEADLRRLVREAAEDDAAEGSRWLELQVDPTSYAARVGGLTPALEIVLDEAAACSRELPLGVGVIVAASRIRHPLDARTLARLAARHTGAVVGFGLSNDERRGVTEEFAPAFRIARDAGLPGVPHAGELLGPRAVSQTLDALAPTRLGHGVRAVESDIVLQRVLDAGVALEVCPGSNIALGVYPDLEHVPLRRLYDAGATVALGADDPLLFGQRLVAQYENARTLGFADEELAELARRSVRASFAPDEVKAQTLRDIDAWLA
ncbi:adenosine deaminase [Calidifontibacter sp. DB0510]|uniref:Adenosine deaminase n=1 Tax=Metallococcus carri TaxID=1656884 RepID=A0A967B0W3_9MICO|nr:adenosine deaminase [Metallococcus carri]NHN55210.1 adenosine deaminase [Metallococcus carri]NOP36287.1 adenosine deaminase [Calidifontibacter sp. DB2511S]